MEPHEGGIDDVLRRSMAAAVPRLSPEFDQRVLRELRKPPPRLNRYGRALLGGYGAISVVAAAVVMRGEGLEWGLVAVMTLGPLAVVAAAFGVRRDRAI